MTVTEKLLDSVQEIWAGYHTHPFVMGIGDGSLLLYDTGLSVSD